MKISLSAHSLFKITAGKYKIEQDGWNPQPFVLLTSLFRIAKRLWWHSPAEMPVLAGTRDALALQSSSARAAWPRVRVCCDLLICRAGSGFKAAARLMVITFSKGKRDAEGVLLDLEKRSPRAINSERERQGKSNTSDEKCLCRRDLYSECASKIQDETLCSRFFLQSLEWGLGLKGILLLHIHIDSEFKRIKDRS